MSKKSRRRNKKLLAMLALAGGAAMAGKGKGEISSNRPSGIDAAMKVASTAAANNAAADAAADVAAITGVQEGNTRLKREGMGPMESVIAKRKIPGYGTAVAPPGILNPYRAPRGPGPRRFSKGGSVKKAKVTGIAKRGFGRALMKGKK
jgi:hypothetical protein